MGARELTICTFIIQNNIPIYLYILLYVLCHSFVISLAIYHFMLELNSKCFTLIYINIVGICRRFFFKRWSNILSIYVGWIDS